MNKSFLAILIITLILLPACKVELGKNKDKKEDSKISEAPVEVVSVMRGDISSFIQSSTTIKADKKVDIYAEISEKISEVMVEEGDTVVRGEILAQFDDSELALIAKKTKINFEKQKSDLERLTLMIDKQLISKDQYEAAKFAEEQAALEWEQAKLNLSKTTIRATIKGVISAKYIEAGERVNMGAIVFSIVDLDNLTAEAYLPETAIRQIKKGQYVEIKSESLQNDRVSGVVKLINPVVDPQTGTVKVTAQIKSGNKLLKPGMFVELNIITDVHKNTLLIPKKALIFENENDFIFLAQNGKAKKVDIVTGYRNTEMVEVLSGIGEDDKVIIVGNNGLKNGVAVKIIN